MHLLQTAVQNRREWSYPFTLCRCCSLRLTCHSQAYPFFFFKKSNILSNFKSAAEHRSLGTSPRPSEQWLLNWVPPISCGLCWPGPFGQPLSIDLSNSGFDINPICHHIPKHFSFQKLLIKWQTFFLIYSEYLWNIPFLHYFIN